MRIFVIILFVFIALQQKDEYPLKRGKPTSRGIDYYVQQNKYKILKEVEDAIGDTIFLDVEIRTDNLGTYMGYDSLDLGYHITYGDGSDEIIIDNQSIYIAYDINYLTALRKTFLTKFNSFVKTTLVHELVHTYFLQVILEMKYYGIKVYPEYDITSGIIRIYPSPEQAFGAEFIEEGICQYIVIKMKQMIQTPVFIPETVTEITNKANSYQIKYNYSQHYLKEFLDYMGLKQGIIILAQNRPPSYEEILNPDLFFKRLVVNLEN